jgi:hypothetical protein
MVTAVNCLSVCVHRSGELLHSQAACGWIKFYSVYAEGCHSKTRMHLSLSVMAVGALTLSVKRYKSALLCLFVSVRSTTLHCCNLSTINSSSISTAVMVWQTVSQQQ